jgi:hypothetical protein
VLWESVCLDDGLIRMTDSATDTTSSVEEPELSTRMVWCTALGGGSRGISVHLEDGRIRVMKTDCLAVVGKTLFWIFGGRNM